VAGFAFLIFQDEDPPSRGKGLGASSARTLSRIMVLPHEYAKTGLVTSGTALFCPCRDEEALSLRSSRASVPSGGGIDTLGNHARFPRHVDRLLSPSWPPRCLLYHVRGDGLSPTMTSFMGVRRAIRLNESVGWAEEAMGREDMARMVLVFRFRRVRLGIGDDEREEGVAWDGCDGGGGGWGGIGYDWAGGLERRGGLRMGSSSGYFPSIRRTSLASTNNTFPRL
jgi:hypothetical protein